MHDLIVIVGPIGSGKTRLAEDIEKARGFLRLDFDKMLYDSYHPMPFHPISSPRTLVTHVAAVVKGRDVVLDGWFSWGAGWWTNEFDDTLARLAEACPDHSIRVWQLWLPAEEACRQFAKKFEEHGIKHYAVAPAEYSDHVADRQDNLAVKVSRWVT